MDIIKALIVEDEENSQIALKNMLEKFCHGVDVVGVAETVDRAVREVNKKKPDLIFLDIMLPEKNGFELLEYFPESRFEVIFTTAYDEYALRAIELSASDYLLKPIKPEKLRTAVQKVAEKKELHLSKEKLLLLRQHLNKDFSKLALPTQSGSIFVELEEIIRCEAKGNYTIFHFTSGGQKMVSKTLKVYEGLFSEINFCRINRKDIINLNHVKEFERKKNWSIRASDGTTLPVSESRREDFLKKIGYHD